MMQKREKQSTQLGAGRIWLWRLTIEYMKERPISWVFGFGIEGYGGRMLADTLAQNRCHNEFLQYMSFFGVPALVFYAGGCLSVFMRALRNKANLTPCQIAALAAALGYLASSFFGVSVINSAPFLFIMLGLAYRSPEQAAGK
jgi:O-antigen ligase